MKQVIINSSIFFFKFLIASIVLFFLFILGSFFLPESIYEKTDIVDKKSIDSLSQNEAIKLCENSILQSIGNPNDFEFDHDTVSVMKGLTIYVVTENVLFTSKKNKKLDGMFICKVHNNDGEWISKIYAKVVYSQ